MWGEAVQGAVGYDMVHDILTEALERKLSDARQTTRVDEDTMLIELGLIDSQDVLDLILEVEQRCGCTFDPERIDLESAITLRAIANAFALS